jgi:predicted transcriptional regulator
MKLKPNKTRSLILRAIKANPNATLRDLQKAGGINSVSAVLMHIDNLLAEGLIARGTRYIVKTQ